LVGIGDARDVSDVCLFIICQQRMLLDFPWANAPTRINAVEFQHAHAVRWELIGEAPSEKRLNGQLRQRYALNREIPPMVPQDLIPSFSVMQ
jgi:hypothetical protein